LGRSADEYVGMFELTSADLSGKLLDCASGPASFNAERTARLRTCIDSAQGLYPWYVRV
jgi:hypothetical protein